MTHDLHAISWEIMVLGICVQKQHDHWPETIYQRNRHANQKTKRQQHSVLYKHTSKWSQSRSRSNSLFNKRQACCAALKMTHNLLCALLFIVLLLDFWTLATTRPNKFHPPGAIYVTVYNFSQLKYWFTCTNRKWLVTCFNHQLGTSTSTRSRFHWFSESQTTI